MHMIKVAICGASGYTGAELLRLLSAHPHVEITALTSEQSADKRITDLYPHLIAFKARYFEKLDKLTLLNKADIFFLALPHSTSQEVASFFYSNGKKVIDLSADFRLKNHITYEQWYKTTHNYIGLLSDAVYGLPEIYREKIKGARLIANPGCYPTSVILGLMPAIKSAIIEPKNITIDSKSGTSGAGRKADVTISFCEVSEGFRAYGVTTHRHKPEIEQELGFLFNRFVNVNFTPHLLPVDRGILSTIYCKLIRDISLDDVIQIYKETYKNEPFVHVLEKGVYPDIKDVRGSNHCMIGLAIDKSTETLIVISVIDNLVKGASGQAIQNMNIMIDVDETTALKHLGLFP